jgi:prevent-host-death family protein
MREIQLREIPLKDAKAALSAVVDGAKAGEPVVITRPGRKEAVIVSWDEWRRLSDIPRGRCVSTETHRPLDSLFSHDLFQKPVSTFWDHALALQGF